MLNRKTKTDLPAGIGNKVAFLPSLLMCVCLIVATLYTVQSGQPPSPVAKDAPKTAFSAGRAMETLQPFSATIHPDGSPEHDQVHDWLITQIKSLGFDPELEKTTELRHDAGDAFDRIGEVQNILARIPGKGQDHHKALLFLTHYDSANHSHGASVGGVGTAAMLETMRALKAGAPLQNDVIFLFVDQSENFHLGSSAFAAEHPWAKDVAVAFNFDAHGSGGPVYMYQTTDNNGWLIQQLADAYPQPFASSLFYTLYQQLHVDTDLTMLKKVPGLEGMDFAFINNPQNFRTANDTLANTDERSLQQDGDYMMALANHFGNIPLTHEQTPNQVFFRFGNLLFIHYPISWTLPLSAVATLFLLGALFYGVRKGLLTAARIVWGFLSYLLILIAGIGAVQLLSMGLNAFINPYAMVTNGTVYLVAFLALGLAVSTALFGWLKQKVGLLPLTVGAALFWLLLLGAVTFVLPAGSYLFVWPVLFQAALLWYLFAKAEQRSMQFWVVLCVLVLPAFVLMVQMFGLLYTLLQLSMPAVLMLFVLLLLGLMFPHWDLVMAGRKWFLTGATAVVCVGFLVAGLLLPAVDKATPEPDLLIYGDNLDTGKAYFAADPTDLDPFLTPFVQGGQTSSFEQFFTEELDSTWVAKDAPYLASVRAPQALVVSDEQTPEGRKLHLKIDPDRYQLKINLDANSNQPLVNAWVNGKPVTNQDAKKTRWQFYDTGTRPDGLDLVFLLQPQQHLQLRLTDVVAGFPTELNLQRPAEYVPIYFGDLTYVTKTFNF